MTLAWWRDRHPLARLERRRRHWLTQVAHWPELVGLLGEPFPGPSADPWCLPMQVLDMEASGLGERERLLSVGTLSMQAGMLHLGQSQHFYLAGQGVAPGTAVINHITPQDQLRGITPKEALRRLLETLHGRVLVAHGAAIERHFLHRLLADHYPGVPEPPLLWLDTLSLERSLSRHRGSGRQDYRLSEVRRERGLPAYVAHNALADTVATGELLLVQMKEILAGQPPTLGALYQRVVAGR
ncbi:3'-5' exonuclease [Aeromonas simiae]|uniref:3'-5' exonuclease n=1 Tax=Aeromonas simiae TaxID=218936 RepID=UPI0005A8B7E9|nr:3'-5' exonuclease [Aeromonas simiae]